MSDTDAEDEKPATGTTDEGADGSGDDAPAKVDPEDKSDRDVYVDRDKIDFDPDDGMLTGTAIDGGTEIPGPHENVDDVEPDAQDGSDDDSGDGSEESGAEDGSDEDSSDD